MLIRKDGHWKEADAADADAVKKIVDEEFADFQKPIVVVLQGGAASTPAKPTKKGK